MIIDFIDKYIFRYHKCFECGAKIRKYSKDRTKKQAICKLFGHIYCYKCYKIESLRL